MKKAGLSLGIICLMGLLCTLFNCASNPEAKSASSPDSSSQDRSAAYTQDQSKEGIFIGILSFANDINDLTNGTIIQLNEGGRKYLLDSLNNYVLASGSGTSLYYAVHKAIVNLSNNESQFPENLSSINLLIFTDGLDNNSTSLALPDIEDQSFRGKSTESYANYVKEQIAERSIANTKITSFTAGVRGNDVGDNVAFTTSLGDLASSNGDGKTKNVYELNNFSELNEKFQDIANSLTIINRDMTFTIITPSYQPGTKIRMTFDVEGNAAGDLAKSARYIEGEVTINDSNYELTNITYSEGVSSSAGTSVVGTLNGTEVSYIFSNFVVADSKWNIKQWNLNPNSSTWQRNSEYNIGDSLKIAVEKHSSVIYLVLDNSRSLADQDIASIRGAVEEFINVLYLKLYPGTVIPSSNKNQAIVNLQPNIWKDDKIGAGEFHYYRFHVKPGQYFIRWNDSHDGDGTKTCDILVTIYQEDTGSSIYFEQDSGYKEPSKISINKETDILIEIKSFNNEQGTYAIMYYQ